MHNQAIAPLRGHYLFAALADGQLDRVAAGAQRFELAADRHLFHAGDPARYFYFLESGQMQLYRLSPAGEEKVIEIIQPGQTFAEAVMFFKISAYPVSARSILASAVWRLDMRAYLGLLEESNALCLNMLGGLSRRLHAAIQDIDQLTLRNASMRVGHLLLQSAPDERSNRYVLEWETPKQVLASRLSVRPETFSRILQQLSRQDLISVHGKSVTVLDRRGLQAALIGD